MKHVHSRDRERRGVIGLTAPPIRDRSVGRIAIRRLARQDGGLRLRLQSALRELWQTAQTGSRLRRAEGRQLIREECRENTGP
jgi:hypothetical protein